MLQPPDDKCDAVKSPHDGNQPVKKESGKLRRRVLWIIIPVFLALVAVFGLGHNILLRSVWNFLVVNQQPKPVDVIIVLSSGMDRVDYGVRLYQQGYAHKLLFTGGSSQAMGRRAASLGVPADDILVEAESGTTFGNAKYSIKIVRAEGFKSAIVVSNAIHTKRASIIFKHFFRGIELTMCPVPYDSSLPYSWWKDTRSENGINGVIGEYLKLVYYFLFERWVPDPR